MVLELSYRSTMLMVADEFLPSVATETLLNVTVNDSVGSTARSSIMVMLIVRFPETPSGQVSVPLAVNCWSVPQSLSGWGRAATLPFI